MTATAGFIVVFISGIYLLISGFSSLRLELAKPEQNKRNFILIAIKIIFGVIFNVMCVHRIIWAILINNMR